MAGVRRTHQLLGDRTLRPTRNCAVAVLGQPLSKPAIFQIRQDQAGTNPDSWDESADALRGPMTHFLYMSDRHIVRTGHS